jgi:hypothetical protein
VLSRKKVRRTSNAETPERKMKVFEDDDWISRPVTLENWTTPDYTKINPFLKNIVISSGNDWSIECGEGDVSVVANLEILFKNDDIAYYAKHLYEIDHTNYIGVPEDSTEGPVIVSVENKMKHRQQDKLKCIVRTGDNTKRIFLPSDSGFKKSIQRICPEFSNIRWEKVKNPELNKELLLLEERSISDTYKIGVLYYKNAKTEKELLGVLDNEVTEDYKKFLDFLGEKITLEGWTRFRGGLDVKCTYPVSLRSFFVDSTIS